MRHNSTTVVTAAFILSFFTAVGAGVVACRAVELCKKYIKGDGAIYGT